MARPAMSPGQNNIRAVPDAQGLLVDRSRLERGAWSVVPERRMGSSEGLVSLDSIAINIPRRSNGVINH